MNKPKYEIGDRLEGTNIYIRGVAQLSSGSCRYFIQVCDNTMVFDDEAIDTAVELLKNHANTARLINDKSA